MFSVSENEDQLSQWRGYVPQGGYSIGFRVADLRQLALINGFKLHKCIYREEDHRALIARGVREIVDLHRRGDLHSASLKLDEGDRLRASVFVRAQEFINECATYFKHPSFYEEAEWRLVGIVSADDAGRARWRTRGNIVLPYCSLNISADGPAYLPARRICVGPSVDIERGRHAIEFLTFGRDPQIEIVKSESSLRAN